MQFRQNKILSFTSTLMAIFLLIPSCKKYLEDPPDKSLVIPSSLADMQALLDNSGYMNYVCPSVLEIASDDYYVNYADWAAQPINDRDNYIWKSDAEYNANWTDPYQTIFYANLILDYLPKIKDIESEESFNNIKGSALFFRAYTFWNIAQLYCLPYSGTSNTDLGIPLRLNSDFNTVSVRSSVQETYDRIIQDLKEAASLLSDQSAIQTRPNKIAAHAALARVYLSMSDFENALRYADSCLQKHNYLLDYNTLDTNSLTPFVRFNNEVIFHSVTPGSNLLSSSQCKVDSSLFNMFSTDDLRRSLYFSTNSDGTHAPKGGYDEYGLYGQHFYGIATDEVYLIRAECYARIGDFQNAIADLNTLLEKRYRAGTYMPLTPTDANDALNRILAERRKELVFRGIRWSDLRRLNRESQFEVTLTRRLDDGQNVNMYVLPPNDLRYVLLIPADVISQSKIPQNLR